MLQFLKKNILIVLLAFLATILLVLKVFIIPQEKPRPPAGISWKGIVPGETQELEVKSKLGEPENTSQQGPQTIFSFGSETGPADRIISENNIVGIIKIHYFEEQSLDSFFAEYGKPDGEFWGEYKTVGFKTYVFLKNGIALVANPNSGIVVQIWYFKPTTITEFLSRWGQELSTEFKEVF